MARCRTHVGSLVGSLGLALLLLAAPSPAAAAPIQSPDRIVDRDFGIWFGTLTVVGAPAFSQDFVELSDHISDGLRAFMQADTAVDPRVSAALPLWVNQGQTNIEWVIGTPEGLPAQQNMLDAFAAFGLAMFGPGSLTTTAPVTGASAYLLASFVTSEIGPVVVGDTDNPVTFGAAGAVVEITNNFVANAQYFEQNAVWTPSPAVVPEPATMSLMLIGLGGLGFARRRR